MKDSRRADYAEGSFSRDECPLIEDVVVFGPVLTRDTGTKLGASAAGKCFELCASHFPSTR